MKDKTIKKAICAGSFDPITLGHVDIINRALSVFDVIHILIVNNTKKEGMFSCGERENIARSAFAGENRVIVESHSGLLADYARGKGIYTIIKGVRSGTDFDYEMQLSLINRELENQIDTFLIPSRAEYIHLSSSFVRDAITYGRDIERNVSVQAAACIRDILAARKNRNE